VSLVWVYDGAMKFNPSFYFRADVSSAGIPANSVLTGLNARANAGASLNKQGQSPGTALKLWYAGDWVQLANNSSSNTSPSMLSGGSTNAAWLSGLDLSSGALSVSVVGTASTPASGSQIVLDEVELELSYRRP